MLNGKDIKANDEQNEGVAELGVVTAEDTKDRGHESIGIVGERT